MATFYWSNGQAQGGVQTMLLTIVGEVKDLWVTSTPSPGTSVQRVPVQGFQECIPMQTVTCGPVPVSFLPLVASGTGCPAPGQATGFYLPTAVSASPNDPIGPGPFCDALTAGGIAYTTPGGGGGGPPPQTVHEKCDAAQNSAQLQAVRDWFTYWCSALRTDQSAVSAYVGAAATAAAIGAGFLAAAIAAGWPAVVVFAILASVCFALALVFSILAALAGVDVGIDESGLASAQQSWQQLIAAVRKSCCPAWITISTNDLVCP